MGRRAVKRAVGAVLFAAALLVVRRGYRAAASRAPSPARRQPQLRGAGVCRGGGGFREALAKEPSSFAAAFNLADALYKQGDYAGAAEVLGALAERSDLTPGQRAKVFHNLGNDMFAQQKLKEAADFYKQSLRENPADLETKYNLAYVQKLLEEQQQEGGGGDDRNQNQNQDQNGNQNRDGDREQNRDGSENRDEGGNDRPDDRNDSDGDDGSDDRDDGGGAGMTPGRKGVPRGRRLRAA